MPVTVGVYRILSWHGKNGDIEKKIKNLPLHYNDIGMAGWRKIFNDLFFARNYGRKKVSLIYRDSPYKLEHNQYSPETAKPIMTKIIILDTYCDASRINDTSIERIIFFPSPLSQTGPLSSTTLENAWSFDGPPQQIFLEPIFYHQKCILPCLLSLLPVPLPLRRLLGCTKTLRHFQSLVEQITASQNITYCIRSKYFSVP